MASAAQGIRQKLLVIRSVHTIW